jgi:hypothetical protein
MDYICAERLTPNLVWLAEHLAAHGELRATPDLLKQLRQISPSTVKRIVARIRQDEPRLRRKRPRPRNHFLNGIPMKRLPWQERRPGYFEVDLVHHCGRTASGEYLYTLQMIDVATAWSERVAVLGRSYLVMQDGFSRILGRLPFSVREIHPDNGREFFNNHMLRFWKGLKPQAHLSRSRPYRKNDNRFVEQKNSTLVRNYLGYHRLDSVPQTLAVNLLYDKMWLYYNFFQPVLRLAEKEWVTKEGEASRVKRVHDKAQTPFDRLCATEAISTEQRVCLEALREQTNPRRLREEINDLLDYIFSLPGAEPGTTEDVHRTLSNIEKPKTPGKEGTAPVTLSFEPTITFR